MSGIDDILAAIDAGIAGSQARWFDFLRIPSVSAQPTHQGDCAAAAEWARAELTGIGFTAEVLPTAGHPCVLAHHPGPGTGPHLLFYGHYDVQPADPLELWSSPPFEPVLVEGPAGWRVIARGAVDDKGQVMTWLESLRAWHAVAGRPPCPITVLLEGEEEVGSPNLEAFLVEHRDRLRVDVAVISDTNMWNIDTPAITTRLRGLAYIQLDLKAASRDLHSGLFGGSALNPINVLTRILGDLHDEAGRIRLPGFYDRVPPVANAQAEQWASLGFDESAFLGGIGLSHPAGESGLPPLHRLWARPTADINGIWGGYEGQGAKTVIASTAHAKVSFRLVPGQEPGEVVEQFKMFVEERLPKDATVEYQIFGLAPGIEIPMQSRFVAAAQAALAAEYGRPPVLIGSGGSIPVADGFRRILGVDSLMVGFGLEDDQVHSPNEKFELRCFRHGIRTHARILGEVSK